MTLQFRNTATREAFRDLIKEVEDKELRARFHKLLEAVVFKDELQAMIDDHVENYHGA